MHARAAPPRGELCSQVELARHGMHGWVEHVRHKQDALGGNVMVYGDDDCDGAQGAWRPGSRRG